MHQEPDVLVIGGGATGLTVALELAQLGLEPVRGVLVLDAESRPGGSWQRAWDTLTVGDAHDLAEPAGLADLGLGFATADPAASVRDVVVYAAARFEDAFDLYVYRPFRVERVSPQRRTERLVVEARGPGGRLVTLRPRLVIDATGCWSTPFVPWVPGLAASEARHLAAARLERVGEAAGRRVLIVGGGVTADDLAHVVRPVAAELERSSRRNTTHLRAFTRDGAVFTDGRVTRPELVLWATGTHRTLRHLAPMRLRERGAAPLGSGWSRRDRRIAVLRADPTTSTAATLLLARGIAEDAIDRLT